MKSPHFRPSTCHSYPSRGAVFLLLAIAGLLAVRSVAAYEPKKGVLTSRWAAQVTPENVLPEYPRPQMVRKDWQNLNGLWEFSTAKEGDPIPTGRKLAEEILVPYPVESPLSGLMRMEDRMWYRRTFTVPAGWAGQRVLLHFGAVDWLATVYVNGRKVGTHQGGYGAFTFDITDQLRAGENEIILNVFDPTDLGHQPVGKQTKKPRGYWYTSVSGIWQTVWLEPVPAAHITSLHMVPDVAKGTLRLTVQGEGAAGQTFEAVASAGGAPVSRATGTIGKEIEISIPKARLWSPEDPFLYGLEVTLKNRAAVGDRVGSYFGMRSISIGSVNGIPRPLLNGKFQFLIGVLDQGFWPDGIYTAPTDEALRFDLEQQKKLGYNIVRKHIKVEPARWYYWADKLGLLVLQDMPSIAPHGLLPDLTEREKGYNPTGDDMKIYEGEFLEMIDQLRNSPAIISWIVFNESWGAYQDKKEEIRLVDWIRAYDPSRLVIADTGAGGKSVAGDALDWHTYPGPNAPPPLIPENRISGQGEFGGQGRVIKDHSWKPVDRDQDTPAIYTARYVDMIHRLKQLLYSPGLSYAIFTQATDVELERNGLFTYDRAVFKADSAALRAAHEDLIAASKTLGGEFTKTFDGDFAKSAGSWTVKGRMTPAGNSVVADGTAIALAKTYFNNLLCETEVTLSSGAEGGLVFRAGDGKGGFHGYSAELSTTGELVLSYGDGEKWEPLKTVSLPIEAGKTYHLRVTAFGETIRIYVDDMAAPKLEARDFRALAGAVGLRASGGKVKFADFHAENPFVQLKPMMANGFVIHDSRQKDIVVVDTNVNRFDDSLWQVVPGLAGQGLSFESARLPGMYLRNRNGRIVFEKDDRSADFKADATWQSATGLAEPAMTSYESLSHPGEYLRCRGRDILRTPIISGGDQHDATFLEVR